MDTGLFSKFLNGNMSGKEAEDFQHNLASNPRLREEFDHFRKIWEASNHYKSDYEPDVMKAWSEVRERTLHRSTPIQNRRFSRAILVRVAASIVLMLAIGTAMYFANPAGMFRQYVTWHSADSIRKVVLPDNSVVWLNKNSSLEGPTRFRGKNRKVKLEGEGFFEIRRDEEHPFMVEGTEAVVRVLGTSFNFKSGKTKDKTSLTLKSGKVEFEEKGIKGGRWILSPGEKLSFDPLSGSLEKTQVSNENYLAWKKGWFRFNNTPIQEVFYELSQFYHVEFSFGQDIPDDMTLSGNFPTHSIDEIIEVIGLSLDLEIMKTGPEAYHVYASNQQ